MILVAGGTGRLGSELVPRLVRAGREVRVLTREPARAAHLVGPGVQVVEGDVRKPATLAPAMTGVAVVVSAVHGFAGPGRVSPGSVDRDGNAHLVDAAARAGADVVLLSVVGAAPDAPMPLFRAKYAAEGQLRASGAGWTIVRATAFTETWAEVLADGVVPGRGQNPITFVSVVDVAAAVCGAVLEMPRRGRLLEICGPDDSTLTELAAAIARFTGRTVRHVPRGVLRACAPVSRRSQAALTLDTWPMVVDRTPRPGLLVGEVDVTIALRRMPAA